MNCGVCNHREVCRCFPNPEEYCSDFEPERPHGEWVWKLDEETGESGWNCPVCNEFGDCKSPYCPNCGADMRGEKE